MGDTPFTKESKDEQHRLQGQRRAGAEADPQPCRAEGERPDLRRLLPAFRGDEGFPEAVYGLDGLPRAARTDRLLGPDVQGTGQAGRRQPPLRLPQRVRPGALRRAARGRHPLPGHDHGRLRVLRLDLLDDPSPFGGLVRLRAAEVPRGSSPVPALPHAAGDHEGGGRRQVRHQPHHRHRLLQLRLRADRRHQHLSERGRPSRPGAQRDRFRFRAEPQDPFDLLRRGRDAGRGDLQLGRPVDSREDHQRERGSTASTGRPCTCTPTAGTCWSRSARCGE
jgi:hypothetical protein